MEPSYFIYNMGKTDFCITGIMRVLCGVGGDIIVLLFFAYTFQQHISRLPFFGTFVKVRKETVALYANVQFFATVIAIFLIS
jgi:hypothetical protein